MPNKPDMHVTTLPTGHTVAHRLEVHVMCPCLATTQMVLTHAETGLATFTCSACGRNLLLGVSIDFLQVGEGASTEATKA